MNHQIAKSLNGLGLTATNAILYNHLNLPTQVTKSTTEKIVYTYDASGRKLMQQVYNSSGTVIKTTEYDGEFIYQGDTLQFINHEEGRIVMKGATAPEYQYHLKDHLGNVRVTFTTQTTNKTYTAGFETANQTTEAANFPYSYPSGSHINTVAANANTGSNSQYLNGGTSGQVGLTKSFSVMPGDVVSLQAYAKYGTPSGTASNFSAFISSLLTAFNLSAPAVGETGTPAAGVNAFGNWEIGATGDESKSDAKKVFVTIILFDRNYNFLDVAYQASSASGALMSTSYTVKQPGYAYLYVSNEHPYLMDVYFDDVTMSLNPSPVVQMEDFYPFGLTFNSYARENAVTQNYLYNQGAGEKKFRTERVYELGWNVDESKFRTYDYAIGRWLQIDPKADKAGQEVWSPYGYSFDNPIRYDDPNGDCIPCMVSSIVSAVASLGTKYSNILKPGQEAGQRLISNKSGSTPSDAGIPKENKQILKTTGVAQDGTQVAKSVGNVTKEVAKDGAKAAKATGDATQKAGILVSAAGLPEVGVPMIAVGAGLSKGGTMLSTAVSLAEGNYAGAAIEAGGALLDNKASGIIKDVAARQGLGEQGRNILEANKEVVKEVAGQVVEQVRKN